MGCLSEVVFPQGSRVASGERAGGPAATLGLAAGEQGCASGGLCLRGRVRGWRPGGQQVRARESVQGASRRRGEKGLPFPGRFQRGRRSTGGTRGSGAGAGAGRRCQEPPEEEVEEEQGMVLPDEVNS